MKKLLFGILLLISSSAIGQLNLDWAFDYKNSAEFKDAIIDTNKNSYLLVTYSQAIDIDPNQNSDSIFFTNYQSSHTFLAKYDSLGHLVWGFPLACPFANYQENILGNALTFDINGNIVIIGRANCPVDFNPTASVDVVNLTNGNGYIASYSSDGNFLWARPIVENNGGGGFANSLEIDAQNNIYLGGDGTGDFDLNPQNVLYNTPPGNSAFLVKYTLSGDIIWFKNLTNTSGLNLVNNLHDIEILPNGEIVCAADKQYGGLIIQKFDSLGSLLDVLNLGNGGQTVSQVSLIGTDEDEIIVSFSLYGMLQLIDDSGNSIELSSGEGTAPLGVVLKLNSIGLVEWIVKLDATGYALTFGSAMDAVGDFYLTGGYTGGSLTISDENLSLNENHYNSGSASYILKINSIGLISWFSQIEFAGSEGSDIWVDNSGGVYQTGVFTTSADFDPSNASYVLAWQPNYYGNGILAFVRKLNQCHISYEENTIEIAGDCFNPLVTITAPNADYYSWSNGDTTQTITVDSIGTYSVYLGNSQGCYAAVNQVTIDSSSFIVPEICDGIDSDCDGIIDNGFDVDGDGLSICNGDCNDNNAAINLSASETCNGIDDNCNSQTDEGFDIDTDNFTICSGDCDDANSLIYPGAPEILDLVDNNCDGLIDEGLSPDADGDGFTVADGDCDDNNASINPNATEICNGIDDNCNTQIDEGFDLDADTFTSCNGDCDDANALIYPGAVEVLDSLDNNCNGQIDEGLNPDPDTDGDGFSLSEGDCNDADPNINPGATELCNGIDDNCDSLIDEGFDLDGDGETSCQGDCDDNNSLVNTAAIELCNSIDDNCDTFINEGLACDEVILQIPNGISPNGDGFNDAWYLPWLNGMTGYSIVISNRWGQVIFQTNDYSTPWDGTYLGNPLPAADYFYVIKLSDNTIYEGVISIKY